jgi:HD-like signal output (HDOD) protein
VSAVIDEELWYGSSTTKEAEQLAAESLAGRVGRVLGAKPFPASALRLARLTRDPRTQMEELLGVLESDPALSARLLRLVNSAGFALRTACTSVRHAAILVGNARLNQVATTAAIMDMYASSAKHATRVLEHATVVGALCRYLAFYLALPSDELFTCGFLHDIGKLMLLDTDGVEYEALLEQAGDEPDALHLLERERFGFDHALLAGHVLHRWNIPQPVPQVVSWHHNAPHAFEVSPQLGQLVSAVRLADHMSYAFQKANPAQSIEQLARTDAAQYLGVSEPQLAAMWDEMAALALRAVAASRSGTGVADAVPDRPAPASLRVVRGSLSAPAQRRIASLPPGANDSLRPLAVPSLEPPSRASARVPAESVAPSERTHGAVLSLGPERVKIPSLSPEPAAISLRPGTLNQAPAVEAWIPGQSQVPAPPLPISIPAPRSPRTATSLKPTKLQPAALEDIRPEMAALTPKHFACVVCAGPTYAATCAACGAYVCPKHQLGEAAWCQLCVEEFSVYKLGTFPPWLWVGLGSCYTLLLAGAALSPVGGAPTRWGSALVIGATLALLAGVGRQAWRKSHFLRSRPRRETPSPKLREQSLNDFRANASTHWEEANWDAPSPQPSPEVNNPVVSSDAPPTALAGAGRRSELPIERIVPQVNAGIMHLQELLRITPDAGTEVVVPGNYTPSVPPEAQTNDARPPYIYSTHEESPTNPRRISSAEFPEPQRRPSVIPVSVPRDTPTVPRADDAEPRHDVTRVGRALARSRAPGRRSFQKAFRHPTRSRG